MKDIFRLLQEWNEVASSWVSRHREQSDRRLSAIQEAVQAIRESSADPRLRALYAGIAELRRDLENSAEQWNRDLIQELETAVEAAHQTEAELGLERLIAFFRGCEDPGADQLCETLLDWLIQRTGAQRGFILFYDPESSAANIVAARNYASTHLALAEYDVSRTLLSALLRSGSPLLLEDACLDPNYSRQASIRRQQVLAVLAVPLQQGDKTVGAVYLEDRRRPGAFAIAHRRLLEAAAVLLMLYLRAAGLLPFLIGSREEVFLDEGRASSDIVGRNPKILSLLNSIDRIADAPAAILIEGESGTGKELVARALHNRSRRSSRPFAAINCAAIPENLLESELFGHERGAFTGAVEHYPGRLAEADGGTVFLDEISELAYPMQAKLLRFLQSQEFQRLGGRETVRVDVRIIAATSKNLLEMAEAGRFQEALYFRLNVIPLQIPPLRERADDVELLGRHFLQRYRRIYGRKVEIRPEVWECLRRYHFPGNVRELENLVHRLVALAGGASISVDDLPPEVLPLRPKRISLAPDTPAEILATPPADLEEVRERRKRLLELLGQQETELVSRMVEEAGSVTAAADRLGVHRVTVHKMLRRARDAQKEVDE